MVGTRSLSSGAHSRDPVALPTLRSGPCVSNRNRELSLGRERPEHALDQRGIAIFLDLFDLAVLDAPDHAILVVIAKACLGDIVAAGLDHDLSLIHI